MSTALKKILLLFSDPHLKMSPIASCPGVISHKRCSQCNSCNPIPRLICPQMGSTTWPKNHCQLQCPCASPNTSDSFSMQEFHATGFSTCPQKPFHNFQSRNYLVCFRTVPNPYKQAFIQDWSPCDCMTALLAFVTGLRAT